MFFDKGKYSRPHAIALLVIVALGAVLRLSPQVFDDGRISDRLGRLVFQLEKN